jgi:hypothetical protein
MNRDLQGDDPGNDDSGYGDERPIGDRLRPDRPDRYRDPVERAVHEFMRGAYGEDDKDKPSKDRDGGWRLSGEKNRDKGEMLGVSERFKSETEKAYKDMLDKGYFDRQAFEKFKREYEMERCVEQNMPSKLETLVKKIGDDYFGTEGDAGEALLGAAQMAIDIGVGAATVAGAMTGNAPITAAGGTYIGFKVARQLHSAEVAHKKKEREIRAACQVPNYNKSFSPKLIEL